MKKRWYEQIGLFALIWCAACSDDAGHSSELAAAGAVAIAGAGVGQASQSASTGNVGLAGKSGGPATSRSVGVAGSAQRAASAGVPSLGGADAGMTAAQGGSSGSTQSDASSAGQGAGGVAAQGAGGAAAVGGSGPSAQGGSGAVGQDAVPSAGCAKRAPRPANGALMMSDRIYTFPAAYDGMTPAPLLLALHAAGNPNTQLQRITQGSKLETDFVRAFPKSAGNAWVYNTDIEKLNGVLAELLAEYCIDEHRIFATGHSSGAQMVVQMLCKGEQRFRAVAPVAASKYCAELASIPVLYIQGQMDAQRGGGNGEDVVRVFRSGNGCGDASAPLASVASCTSSFDRKEVMPGCVSYEGCSVPTHWCSHNDNGYNNSDGRQHGWPCFANGAISDFFLSF
jgi:polyhydroxybutyrate depolymerase